MKLNCTAGHHKEKSHGPDFFYMKFADILATCVLSVWYYAYVYLISDKLFVASESVSTDGTDGFALRLNAINFT